MPFLFFCLSLQTSRKKKKNSSPSLSHSSSSFLIFSSFYSFPTIFVSPSRLQRRHRRRHPLLPPLVRARRGGSPGAPAARDDPPRVRRERGQGDARGRGRGRRRGGGRRGEDLLHSRNDGRSLPVLRERGGGFPEKRRGRRNATAATDEERKFFPLPPLQFRHEEKKEKKREKQHRPCFFLSQPQPKHNESLGLRAYLQRERQLGREREIEIE